MEFDPAGGARSKSCCVVSVIEEYRIMERVPAVDQRDPLLKSSENVEAVGVHHFGPRRHEVIHEFFLRVGGPVDFREGAELRV